MPLTGEMAICTTVQQRRLKDLQVEDLQVGLETDASFVQQGLPY